MIQFFADSVDQLDLAIDQLAFKDRNYDRFALMLIDNVVELSLHQFAEDKYIENNRLNTKSTNTTETVIIKDAIGPYFKAKLKCACKFGLINEEMKNSLQYLHSFRNTAYHQGKRHESILHSLGIFYIICCCEILNGYSPKTWRGSSKDIISFRTRKYIGNSEIFSDKKIFSQAYIRIRDLAITLGNNLITDLSSDLNSIVEETDKNIDYLSKNSPEDITRNQVIIDAQAWDFAFSDDAMKFAWENGCPAKTVDSWVEWLGKNYNWKVKSDPIESWRKRVKSIENEINNHRALKKYCDFIKSTEDIRRQIDEAVLQLDNYINSIIKAERERN